MLAFIFAPFYILVNLYLVRWVLRWTGACHKVFGSKTFRVIFISIYVFASLTPLTSFVIHSPAWLHRLLEQISNYWFGWLAYLILAVLLTEAVLFAVRRLRGKDFAEMQRVRQVQGGIALALLCVVSFYGMAHAERLYITDYTVEIDKPGEDMTVALLADLHLGYSTDPDYIEEVAQAVNEMRPDLVVLAGDIFDNEYEAVPEPEAVKALLKNMHSTYGTYACWGNHDLKEPILAGFTWSTKDENKNDPRMERFLTEAGITLLADQTETLPNGVQLAGRKDPARAKKVGEARRTPEELLGTLDQSAPIFVIDHQPKELAELAAAGADLDLSGHTHDGQVFPGNLIIKLMWRNACGYLNVNGMHSVVTSGVGVWGPAMRVGTKSEVARIHVRFTG
ncbi:metallophosphoesterase [Agathobaculum sp.]|uniref:metallophosphoesterase n=1 Tax=Agathobaculum sp. TaxID=2048138 RepID=UPI002A81CDEC|nr:metallophosphoesterase [Agathobaculum sp.]MDY3617599.1 metallophosphoesterase [Agathobaculum sp.]